MALKQQHMTRWNGDEWHKDEFITNRDITYSSKHETTIFEF